MSFFSSIAQCGTTLLYQSTVNPKEANDYNFTLDASRVAGSDV
jgi:hypothetical protein